MKNLIWLNIRNSFILVISIILFILFMNWIDSRGQTILVYDQGVVFEKGVYYDNNSTLEYIYKQPELYPDNPTYQWDIWVSEGYLGKRGQWYYIRFPEHEKWGNGVICYYNNHKDLKWFNNRKVFGWDVDDTVEPIEVHYREYRFRIKNDELVEKQKGVLLKNNNNGHQDLKDVVYDGLKGSTIAFENRVKPKPKLKK